MNFFKIVSGKKKMLRDITSIFRSSRIESENQGKVNTYLARRWWIKELAVLPLIGIHSFGWPFANVIVMNYNSLKIWLFVRDLFNNCTVVRRENNQKWTTY